MIIQTATIGDVILATPIIESIALADPSIQIDFLLRKGAETLFAGHPYLRNVFVWDKSQHKYPGLMHILKSIRETRYDIIIDLHRFISSGFVTTFSKARYKIGFNKNPLSFLFDKRVKHIIGKSSELHEVDRNLLLIRDIFKPVRIVKLYPSNTDFANVEAYKSVPFITIAPSSLWGTKKYPEEKWIEFIEALPVGFKIYLIGSNSDIDLCNRIARKCVKHDIQNLSGTFSLLETAALMKDAHMNFTNDSAPQHLASAMNAPITGVFCSTVPEFGFGPLSDISFIVEIEEKLYCRPCGLHGYRTCPEKHFKCAYDIKKEQLLVCLPS